MVEFQRTGAGLIVFGIQMNCMFSICIGTVAMPADWSEDDVLDLDEISTVRISPLSAQSQPQTRPSQLF
jgi:hypothetical protein